MQVESAFYQENGVTRKRYFASIGCRSLYCRNLSSYRIFQQRAPGNLDILLCNDCLTSLVKSALSERPDILKDAIKSMPVEELLDVLNEIPGFDDEQVNKTGTPEEEESETPNLDESPKEKVNNSISKENDAEPSCGECKHKFKTKKGDKAEEPCKTCKADQEAGKGFTKFVSKGE